MADGRSPSRRAMPEKIAQEKIAQEKITVQMRAEDLPDSITARMKQRSIPGMPYRVTIEPVEDEAEKLEALKRDILAGVADIEAGRVAEADDVFARLRARLPKRD